MVKLNQIVSKAYAGLNGTGNLNIYKGIAAGNINISRMIDNTMLTVYELI